MSSGMQAERIPATTDLGKLWLPKWQASFEPMRIHSGLSFDAGLPLVKILKYRRIDIKSVCGPGEEPGQPHGMTRVLPEHTQGVQRCSPR